jgi:hypothetical protein
MARLIYALLVGIDDYPSPIPKLRGCVNDIESFAEYLAEKVDREAEVAVRVHKLKDGEATRQSIIDAFRQHFRPAGLGDVAVFYYSGHGSQEQAPEEFWPLEPDHLDETLVCYDSRQEGQFDLADKELAKLISEVAARGPHIAVVLDCCHSGSGTRRIDLKETAVRRAPTDLRRRRIDSFLVSPQEAAATFPRKVGGGGGISSLSQGRHVLLAACQDNQEARECNGNGRSRGDFSYFLGEALRTATGAPTYRDLFARVAALVSSQVSSQSPQLEASRGSDLDAVFLDGALRPSAPSFTASFQGDGWRINAGAVHGIPRVVGGDAVCLALFPFDSAADTLRNPAEAVATAMVSDVFPTWSRIEAKGNLDAKTTFKAVITSLPTPALSVRLEGEAATLEIVRVAIAKAGPGGQPSLFIREAGPAEAPEFRLLGHAGQYVIARLGEDRPLVAQIEGLTEGMARLAVSRLEHIARWTQTARLTNPSSTIQPGEVRVAIFADGRDVSDREIRVEYRPTATGEWVAPRFKVSLSNTGSRELFCGLLDLTERFKVDAGLLPAGHIRLAPGETAWALGGQEVQATVPDELWQQGVVEFRDLLKLIVCTQEFDARLLEQDALDLPRKAAMRALPRDSTLNRLLRRVQTRDLGAAGAPVIDDWQTSQTSFTTVRPLAASPVPAAESKAEPLPGGSLLHGHSAFKAKARLSTAPLASRDLGGMRLPRLFIDDPVVSVPFPFTVGRGADPGLSVLELTEVSGESAVTSEAPLRLTVPVHLATNEHVLPVGWDGELYLPLGRVAARSEDATDVVLERLPPPLVDRRSLGGAIKIFFQKVISRLVGLDFPYPLLAAADVAPDCKVLVVDDPSEVRQRVTLARRVVLFVHGIIGDTRSMVPAVQLGRLDEGRPLAGLYDLVLTYDYENLGTTIEENGRGLKRRLEEVGLGAGHSKSLDVVAHSMGGLVSRWFIEREGGNRVVRRLIMLGTPNGGSPWPRVVDWATIALAASLNQLTAIPWPASVLGGLTALIERPTVALDQMAPTSDFLKTLAASPDPGIPYHMLAGNTSIIPAATAVADTSKGSMLGRLLGRLASPDLIRSVANPFFFGQANDVAVAVASMGAIAGGRTPPYDVCTVACDHMSYFRDEAGLKALALALADG